MGGQRVTIKLSREERKELLGFVNTGNHPAKLIKRANVILALDSSYNKTPSKEADICTLHNISKSGVHKIKDAYLEGGVDSIVTRRKRMTPPVPSKIDGCLEARIIALACQDPPEGYAKWTVRMLADKTVELGYIKDISHTSVAGILKKTNSSPI